MTPAPVHGGRLIQAARHWGIPLDHWLDLSTGINRRAWPVPPLPDSLWRQLPDEDDGLEAILREWAQVPRGAGCLPVPGSQAAIQTLPLLRRPCRVGVPTPAFAEHARYWALAGHDVVPIPLDQAGAGDAWLDTLDVMVWINPNNPTGMQLGRERLLEWHRRLVDRNGWLVVDEAFADGYQGLSLTSMTSAPGLVVMRSLGKFFGLAGLRAGAVFAQADITDALAERLGPWAMATPSRYLMIRALKDQRWQQQTRARLEQEGLRLDRLLAGVGLPVASGSLLFRYVVHPEAHRVAEYLARQGILVRRFDTPPALRFGLPGDEFEWQRLERTLGQMTNLIDRVVGD